MPRGAAVIPYDGKRGRVWRIKYADAAGKQVMETIEAERDGVTRSDQPTPSSGRGSSEWREGLPPAEADHLRRVVRRPGSSRTKRGRGWKPKTAQTHGHRLAHPVAYVRQRADRSIRPGNVTAYIQQALGDRSARTVIAEVNLLHDIFGRAVVEELIQDEPRDRGRAAEGEADAGGGSSNPRRFAGSRPRSPTSGRGRCS